ncbi:hypothetical protein [Halomonas sp. TD01]|uniref:hypothetical protein n=1 Tax=Halomonas sp. TD01 TaxID=999141 RepID=UPI000214E5E6|nr:hypothetical protein [Halomonas sp. TD01]EGP18542.1 hypothetical protein GME_16422 [Halomonas sp. TD01]CAH1044560.1 hypothetical protein HPTD01_3038 [Halomonas sp. TD01]
MASLTVYRETALPGTLTANSIYFVAPASRPDYVEIYVTGNDPATVKRVIDEEDVQALIDASMASGGANTLEIVNDIAARDALVLEGNTLVLVLDASADATVASGAATYAYRHSDTSWTKISEAESLDINFNWSSLADKPVSAVSDIDDAVTKRHAHANKTQLDKIDEDANGNMTYGGSLPVTAWASNSW